MNEKPNRIRDEGKDVSRKNGGSATQNGKTLEQKVQSMIQRIQSMMMDVESVNTKRKETYAEIGKMLNDVEKDRLALWSDLEGLVDELSEAQKDKRYYEGIQNYIGDLLEVQTKLINMKFANRKILEFFL